MNVTHDPRLKSWVESANAPSCDFPIQNLPIGIFSRRGDDARRVGVAIGESILDVRQCVEQGLLRSAAAGAATGPTLNALMALPSTAMLDLRLEVSDLLAHGGSAAEAGRRSEARILVPASDADMHLPAAIGDYTDFYASIEHATNVGSMFRPDNPLLPNYKYVPIGYHGRASSIVPSGTPVRRPRGQTRAADAAEPSVGPSRMLDYEGELGFFVRGGNQLGVPVPLTRAREHIFGFCLVNDWSARDIQAWEYQPLGPFLAKNFATSVSPWVITAEAAEPYRTPPLERPLGDPAPLPYLSSEEDRIEGALTATIEVFIVSAKMREAAIPPVRLSSAAVSALYWTMQQMLAHHTSNGCNLAPGDLLATGTVSGDSRDSRGCLLELTWRGAQPVPLPGGETRRFLEDGDEVILRGFLESADRPRLGFGECRGTILPAVPE